MEVPVQEEKRLLWYLKKIPLLEAIPAEALAELVAHVEMREVRRRHVIYIPGDPGNLVYFLNGGRVKVSKVTRDGRELTLAYRVPGEIFGELCLVEGTPREEMAEAMDNALITSVERTYFESLVRRFPALSLELMRLANARRREVESKIARLIFRDVNSKLAELLLNLGMEYGVEDSRGTLVAIKITHQEMANLIGSTRETVSLTLSQFKRQGLITMDGRKIIVIDYDGLKALA
jgi:CRP/FNR family transcriptional regulator, cyclic AMP receptor protein